MRARDDFHQQTANAHAGDVLTPDRKARKKTHQHPVKTVLFGTSCAARRTHNRNVTRLANQHQIAGIDRHAEMFDLAANRFKRRGNNVTPVGNCGSAENNHQLSTGREQFIDRFGERCLIMRHATLGKNRRTGICYPVGHDFEGLLNDLRRKTRQ